VGRLAAARSRLHHVLSAGEQRRLLAAVVRALEETPAPRTGEKPGPAALDRAESELTEICAGRLPATRRQTDQPSAAATEEALYYLRRYGSVREALSFLQRHSLYGRAVEESARAVPEHFHRALLLPAVRSGQLAALLAAMRAASASLAHWQQQLQYSCGRLRQAAAWHTLLQIQLACGDQLRAADSCVKMFCGQSSYQGYAQALHHL